MEQAVLLVALARRYGGAEVRVFDLARAFHGRFPYAVVTIKGSVLDDRLTAAGLTTRPQSLGRGDPRLAQAIGHLIRTEGYQIVDAHNPQSQLWGLWAAKRAHVPVLVSTVHLAYGRVQNDSFRGRLYEQVLRLNYRWGCRFVTVSESIRDYLHDIGVPQVALIDNAIDLDAIAHPEPDLTWREALGWDQDKVVVAVVGRLEPQKGHTYLVEALRQAVARRPQLRCILVGEGHLRPSLTQQIVTAQVAEYIHLAGFRGDVPAILSGSDVFCLSSLAEGLPYAMLEAVAHRLPLLVTAVDGMAERLTHRETAYMVPPANPEALADGLCWLVDHPEEAQRLGLAAHQMVRERFNPERMVAETLAIYGVNG
jgi:glycosyltransferase involved in cell wall biosynthesis